MGTFLIGTPRPKPNEVRGYSKIMPSLGLQSPSSAEHSLFSIFGWAGSPIGLKPAIMNAFDFRAHILGSTKLKSALSWGKLENKSQRNRIITIAMPRSFGQRSLKIPIVCLKKGCILFCLGKNGLNTIRAGFYRFPFEARIQIFG